MLQEGLSNSFALNVQSIYYPFLITLGSLLSCLLGEVRSHGAHNCSGVQVVVCMSCNIDVILTYCSGGLEERHSISTRLLL